MTPKPPTIGCATLLSLASRGSILVGLVLTGPLVCMWISCGLARLSGRRAMLIAVPAHRSRASRPTAIRAVTGVAFAVFAATLRE
jgi:hypothetical protein